MEHKPDLLIVYITYKWDLTLIYYNVHSNHGYLARRQTDTRRCYLSYHGNTNGQDKTVCWKRLCFTNLQIN